MPIDPGAKSFIEANIDLYREVTLAVQEFEQQVESVLRSIWREFKEQLDALGVRQEDALFKAVVLESASDLHLKSRAKDAEIGIALQCREQDDKTGRFAVYSWVWVKDPDLRKSLDRHVATHSPDRFVHEFEYSTTYISKYLDFETKVQAIDLLRDSFGTLFECLFSSPEFCKSYNLSGPTGAAGAHR